MLVTSWQGEKNAVSKLTPESVIIIAVETQLDADERHYQETLDSRRCSAKSTSQYID